MVELTNRYRVAWGLPRLRVSTRLQAAAEWLARDKARHGFNKSHYDSLGRWPDERFADFDYDPADGWTENLASGSGSAAEVMEAWRQSPYHDANLRKRDARVIGVGAALNPRTDTTVWVADYGVYVEGRRAPSTGVARIGDGRPRVGVAGCPRTARVARCRAGATVVLRAVGTDPRRYLRVQVLDDGRWRAWPGPRRRKVTVGIRVGTRLRVAAAAGSSRGPWLTVVGV